MSLQAPLQFHGRHVLISRTECMTRGAYGRALLNCLVDPKHVSSSCAKAELSNEGIALGLICEPRAKKVFVTVALLSFALLDAFGRKGTGAQCVREANMCAKLKPGRPQSEPKQPQCEL